MKDDELNSMEYYAVSETMKTIVQQTIAINGNELPEDVKELTQKLLEDVIDNSVKHKQIVAGLLTFAVTSVLNSTCKLLYDKWLVDLTEKVDDE